jgi:cytoskeleton protein RodZ
MDTLTNMQTNSPQDDTVEARQTLGSLLTTTRKAKGKTLEDISKSTGISISKLQALEDGDRRRLPADVFVRGFIRLYSAEIGLDSQVALNMFEQEWGGEQLNASEERRPLQAEAFAKSSIVLRRWPSFVTIIILCTIAYYAADFFFPALFVAPTKQIGEILSNKLPEIEIINQTENQQEPLPFTETANSADQTEESKADDLIPGQASTPDESEEAEHEIQEQMASPKTIINKQSGTATGTSTSAAPHESAKPATSKETKEATHYKLHIQFTERTWVKISLDGQYPQEEIFKRGSVHTWDADKSIDLYLGNAGGVKITLNGEPMPLKQESGQTVRLQIP